MIERIQKRLFEEGLTLESDASAVAHIARQEAGVISDVDLLELLRRLRDDTTGAGQLEKLLALPGVTDILVNGPDEVFLDRGQGLEPADLRFRNDAEVRRLATRLAASCGRRLDDAQPFVDGRITRTDGTAVRMHAMLSPPSRTGTLISLRVLGKARTRLADLVAGATMPAEVAEVLRAMVRNRISFLVIGGTGTGKTTLLSALIAEASHEERILLIEDTAELDPNHPHVVGLTTRAANAEDRGAITMSDLLIQALRMRPDRLVVGEIRGKEVVDLLTALNTGHDGGAGTLHANSAEEVPARMEALAALGGMDRSALHSQLSAAVDVVAVMERDEQGKRRLSQLASLHGNPVQVTEMWRAGQPVTSQLWAMAGEKP